MALTAAQKSAEVAKGAGQGIVINALVIGAVHGAGRLVPRAAPVIATGLKLASGAGVAIIAGGAVVGGVQAYRRGDSVIGGAIKGSLGIFPAAAADTRKAKAKDETKPAAAAADVPQADPKALDDLRREKLGAPFGSYANRIDLALKDATAKAGDKSQPQKFRDWWEVRQNALTAEKEKISAGAVTTAAPQKGLVAEVKEKIFGSSAPKPEDALSKQRTQLEGRVGEVRSRMQAEFKNGGPGKKYDKLKDELAGVEKELKGLTGQQEAKDAESAAAYRSVGAMAAGVLIGGLLARGTKAAATAATEVASKGIDRLATQATKLIKSAPKGVIAGTVAGDKAKAAVAAARAAAAAPAVSKVEAFGLPAFNIMHGAAAYAYSAYDHDNPASPILRAEGTAAIAAGAIGAKFGMAAYAMRATVSPTAAQKLEAVANRVAREARKGPASVAQARGRELSAVASGQAALAGIRAGRDVRVATALGERSTIAAGAKITGARLEAGVTIGVAKAQGASTVAVAEARGKQAISRQIKKGEVNGYKDTWQDARGRIYHRKDMSVRRAAAKAPANDNGGQSRARSSR